MNFVNVFIVVPVTAVPYIIIRTLFDFIKPFFCNCINIGSVNTGQELDRFIPERAGCDNTTSILCCCNCLSVYAFISSDGFSSAHKTVAAKQAYLFIHAVCTAEHDTFLSIKIINISVLGKQQLRKFILTSHLIIAVIYQLI